MTIGDRVKDRITGLVGISIGHAEYADGRRQSLVQPERLAPDGAYRQPVWVDDNRVEVLEADAVHLDPPAPCAYL